MLKVRAGGFGVVAEGWDGHEAGDGEVLERNEGLEERGKRFRSEAVLGFFGGELDLDEDGDLFAEGYCGVVEAGCGFEGVEGVDGLEEFRGAGGFVVLEGADEVEGAGDRG